VTQFDRLPPTVTHLVVSAGGNDALAESEILDQSARSVGEVLIKLADIQDRFRRTYATLLDAVARRKLPTAVCSVYEPRFPDPVRRRIGALALSVINDVITREAFTRQFTLIASASSSTTIATSPMRLSRRSRRDEAGARHTGGS
jgi:hypothetical protein